MDHWSCSDFAEYCRTKAGLPAMRIGTTEQWDAYEKECKHRAPYVYWLTNDALDKLQEVVYLPVAALDNLSYWMYNTVSRPAHLIKTDLPAGEYHTAAEKILHGVFQELMDFVEVDLARDYQPRGIMPRFIRILTKKRSQQHGVQYLLDCISDIYGDRASLALEALELYVWWKFIRPARDEPEVASGWKEVCRTLDSKGGSMLLSGSEHRDVLDIMNRIEQDQCNEDTVMLARLVCIRHFLVV